MHLIYIDDSFDHNAKLYTFSGLAIPDDGWAASFAAVRKWRREIRDSDGILISKELHAVDFCTGRGRVGPRTVTKHRRSQIFHAGLVRVAGQNVQLFNCALYRQDWAFERLLNRINRTMQAWDSNALLICDEGKEAEYTRLVRRMSVHNPIPSRFGVWLDTGQDYKNIPIERIIEDPFFKQSDKSYFVQMADWCAYALLQRERPIPSRKRYNLHKAFDALTPICVKATNPKDPLGIIR